MINAILPTVIKKKTLEWQVIGLTSGLEERHKKHPPCENNLKEDPSSVRGRRTRGTFILDANDVDVNETKTNAMMNADIVVDGDNDVFNAGIVKTRNVPPLRLRLVQIWAKMTVFTGISKNSWTTRKKD